MLVWGCSVADSVESPCEDDDSMVIVSTAIFYGIEPPDTYSTADANSATPTLTSVPVACGDAVADKSNTGLVSDCNALLAARDALRGTAALNWSPNTAIAGWDGIILGGSPKRVTKIGLQKKELNGQIPPVLARLDALEELWLYNNALAGTIPPELGALTSLRWLFLSTNELSGQIPETLNNLTLDRLWLNGNDFTGCVPYNLMLTREYKVDRGLPTCAPPTPTGVPVALDNMITWHIHCQESDFVDVLGEKYVMDDERTWHTRYGHNGRGLWQVLRTIWWSPSSPERSVACMTKVYDNVSSAIFDNHYTAMVAEALGDSDVLRQRKRCCKEIGTGFKGLMLDIGSTFSDGRWQDTLTSRSGVASFRRGQVIVRIASYDQRSDGGYHLLEVDEMARRVNSRFYEGIFDEIQTRNLSGGAGVQARESDAERPLYLNPVSRGDE